MDWSEMTDEELTRILREPKEFELKVVGDYNDLDYDTMITLVGGEELGLLKPWFAALQAFKSKHNGSRHNWDWNEDVAGTHGLDPDYVNFIQDRYAPSGDSSMDCPVHTIESIEYYPIPTGKVIVI